MSDPTLDIQRQLLALENALERLRKADAGTGAGSSFPASPATGLLFFRSDLGFLCYYDGARWLTIHEYSAVMSTSAATSTVTNANLLTVAQRDNYAIDVTRIETSYFVATTNNGTNFWTITHQGQDGTFGTANNISSFDTSGAAANAWGTFDVAPNVTATPANYRHLNISVSKTNAPGQLSILSTVYYRLIVT